MALVVRANYHEPEYLPMCVVARDCSGVALRLRVDEGQDAAEERVAMSTAKAAAREGPSGSLPRCLLWSHMAASW